METHSSSKYKFPPNILLVGAGIASISVLNHPLIPQLPDLKASRLTIPCSYHRLDTFWYLKESKISYFHSSVHSPSSHLHLFSGHIMCDKVEIVSDNSVLSAVPIECPVCGTTGSSGATCPGCGNGMPSYQDTPLTIKDGKWGYLLHFQG